MGKNDRKIYNFHDPAEFEDAAVETRMVDDQPIGTSHDVPEGNAFLQDATHGDAHGNTFGAGFGDPICFRTCT